MYGVPVACLRPRPFSVVPIVTSRGPKQIFGEICFSSATLENAVEGREEKDRLPGSSDCKCHVPPALLLISVLESWESNLANRKALACTKRCNPLADSPFQTRANQQWSLACRFLDLCTRNCRFERRSPWERRGRTLAEVDSSCASARIYQAVDRGRRRLRQALSLVGIRCVYARSGSARHYPATKLAYCITTDLKRALSASVSATTASCRSQA